MTASKFDILDCPANTVGQFKIVEDDLYGVCDVRKVTLFQSQNISLKFVIAIGKVIRK